MADEQDPKPTEDTAKTEAGQAPPTEQQGPDGAAPPKDDTAPAGKTYDEKTVKQLRDEAAKRRQEKTAAEQERDETKARLDAVLKALDPNAGKDDDPAAAAQKALSERDQHAAELRAERLERAAEKAARRLGVNEVALLDSRGFLTALAKIDPSADGFGDDIEAAVNAAVGANPSLKAEKPTPTPTPTSEMGGGEGKGDPTSIEARRKARRDRRAG